MKLDPKDPWRSWFVSPFVGRRFCEAARTAGPLPIAQSRRGDPLEGDMVSLGRVRLIVHRDRGAAEHRHGARSRLVIGKRWDRCLRMSVKRPFWCMSSATPARRQHHLRRAIFDRGRPHF